MGGGHRVCAHYVEHVTGAPPGHLGTPTPAPRRLGQVGNGAANDFRAAQAEAERLL